MAKIKTGIIGCGKVAHLHAAALRSLPDSEFTAVYSNSPQRAKDFAAKYGVAAYSSLPEMLERSGVQMLCVCSQHPQHAKTVVAAAAAGVHSLVEKSLASDLADCDAMIAACQAGGVKLGTICQRRFYEPCLRVKRAITGGKIGQAIIGTVAMYSWRDEDYYKSDPWRGKWIDEGGGVLVNQAPHQLDLLRWYMGPIVEVSGFWGNLNHPYIEVEDTAVAIVRFASGALGQILVSNSQNPALYCNVHVYGSNGASIGVQTDGGAMFVAGRSSITEPPYNDLWTVPGEEAMLAQWKQEDADFFRTSDAMTYYHGLQIKDFLAAIADDRPPLVTGQDGRDTVELFTAIYRSQRDKKVVTFPLPTDDGHHDFDGRTTAR